MEGPTGRGRSTWLAACPFSQSRFCPTPAAAQPAALLACVATLAERPRGSREEAPCRSLARRNASGARPAEANAATTSSAASARPATFHRSASTSSTPPHVATLLSPSCSNAPEREEGESSNRPSSEAGATCCRFQACASLSSTTAVCNSVISLPNIVGLD